MKRNRARISQALAAEKHRAALTTDDGEGPTAELMDETEEEEEELPPEPPAKPGRPAKTVSFGMTTTHDAPAAEPKLQVAPQNGHGI